MLRQPKVKWLAQCPISISPSTIYDSGMFSVAEFKELHLSFVIGASAEPQFINVEFSTDLLGTTIVTSSINLLSYDNGKPLVIPVMLPCAKLRIGATVIGISQLRAQLWGKYP